MHENGYYEQPIIEVVEPVARFFTVAESQWLDSSQEVFRLF